MKNNIIKILIVSGEPAGIGLDLCIQLARKKFEAEITILSNQNAILDRAKLRNTKIKILAEPTLHLGNGGLNIINVNYSEKVLPGILEKSNSMDQLQAIEFAVKECIEKKYDALVTLPINKR